MACMWQQFYGRFLILKIIQPKKKLLKIILPPVSGVS
jgi:hypothetical protein